MIRARAIKEEEDSFEALQESDLDLEEELKKIQMIEEDEIRKGKASHTPTAAKKKNKGSTGEGTNRVNEFSSRNKEERSENHFLV